MHTDALDEPLIAGIADRLRGVLQHRPAFCAAIANEIGIPTSQIDQLFHCEHELIDAELLIDVIAIVVQDDAIDPHWLLTGEYDLDTHRAALALVEDNSTVRATRSELRSLVCREWTKQQISAMPPLQFRRAS